MLLIIVEVTSFTFILCFFGIGALLVSFTTWIHLTTEIYSQVILFSVISVGLMLLMRKTLKKLFPGTKDKAPDYLGQKGKVIKMIGPNQEGSISYRGSLWNAFCDGNEIFKEGEMVEIVAMDGIRMKIKRSINLTKE
jgi:membrane protein implicated in regulation of membrane protease activity